MKNVEARKVVVVDDDHAGRASLRLLLEVAGHVVETFEIAAEFLQAEIPNLACLILDHRMPHMTGLELAGRLRAEGTVIPILLITSSVSPIMFARAAELGIETVLEKPFDVNDLLDFVRRSSV